MTSSKIKPGSLKIDVMQGAGEERTEQYERGIAKEHRSPKHSSTRFSAKRFAVFDVDGTVFRSSLLIELVEELIEAGIFDEAIRDQYAREKEFWLDRKAAYYGYIDKVVEAFMENIRGVKFIELQGAGERVVDRLKDRLYTYTRDMLPELKKEGYFLLAVSNSPKLVLDEFCKRLGFDKVYGRIYEVGPENRFTGKVEDLHLIANKVNILKRAAEKEGLVFEGSIGVGDTEGDISMLEMVERPICFNPSRELYKTAKRLGWKVVVERKDMVYEL